MSSPAPIIRLKADRVVWQQTGDEVVVLDLRSSTYLAVNAAGRTLWPGLEAGATVAELEATLASIHGLEPATAAADVEAFLASLRALDLLDDGVSAG